jgi:hypothetical protein
MADAETPNEVIQTLIGVGDKIVDAFEGVGVTIVGALGKAGVDGAKSLGDNFKAGLENAKAQLSGLQIFENLIDFAYIQGEADKMITELRTNFEGADIKAMIGLDQDSVKAMFSSLDNISNKEFAIKFGAYFAADQIMTEVEKVGKTISDQETKILELTQGAFDNMRQNTAMLSVDIVDGGNKQTRAFGDMQKASKTYRQETIRLMEAWGQTGDEADKAINAMLGAGLAIEQIASLEANVTDGTAAIQGIEAAFIAAKATGLSYAEVGDSLNRMVRSLGVETTEAAQKFELLARVQSGTKMKIGDVNAEVMKAADSMKYYGDNVDSAAALYKGFLRTFGEGREMLAGDLFQEVTSSIANMDTGMRAFLGMTTQIGTGGGGAIGGALEVERALETGDGMEQVIASIQETVERFSGGPLMNREEAIESGQQQQYFMGREILGQQLGISDPAKLENIIKMMQSQNVEGIKQAMTATGPGSGFDAARVAQEATVKAGGGTAQALNRIDAGRRGMQEGMVDDLVNNGVAFNKALKDGLIQPLTNLKKLFMSDDFLATFETMKANSETGGFDKTPSGKALMEKSLEGDAPIAAGQNTVVGVRGAAGYDTARAQHGVVEVTGKTGRTTGDELSSSAEIFARTQQATAKQLSETTTIYAATGRELVEEMNSNTEALKNLAGRITADDAPLDEGGAAGPAAFNLEPQKVGLDVLPSGPGLTIEEIGEIIKRTAEDQKKAADQTATGPQEREVLIKAILELDPNGYLNIKQVMSDIAEQKAKSVVSERSTQHE